MGIDFSEIGTYIGAIALGLGTFYGQHALNKAKAKAEEASYGTDRTISDTESTLYVHLRDRLTALEADTLALRGELDKERRHSRYMELHIWKLEKIMRNANLEPPTFIDFITKEEMSADEQH